MHSICSSTYAQYSAQNAENEHEHRLKTTYIRERAWATPIMAKRIAEMAIIVRIMVLVPMNLASKR